MSCFVDIDHKWGLPSGFLASVWEQETGSGRDTYNERSGCKGHFQFQSKTRDEVLRKSGFDAFSKDPREAANAAGFYYAQLKDQFDGNISKALAAYNWGMGNLARQGMDNMPNETRNYIAEILGRIGGSSPAEDAEEEERRKRQSRVSVPVGKQHPERPAINTEASGEEKPGFISAGIVAILAMISGLGKMLFSSFSDNTEEAVSGGSTLGSPVLTVDTAPEGPAVAPRADTPVPADKAGKVSGALVAAVSVSPADSLPSPITPAVARPGAVAQPAHA